MAVSDLGTPGTGPSGNYQRCTPEGPSSTGSRSNWSFLKLRDEGWRFHLWENCNLGDAQLVAAARCERIYRQLKRGGLRFHHGSVASFIQRETAAAICIHANAPHQDGRQLNFWKMTGGGTGGEYAQRSLAMLLAMQPVDFGPFLFHFPSFLKLLH